MKYVNSPPKITVPVVDTHDAFLVNRVFCVGRNYQKHVNEMGYTDDETPFVFFMKPNDAIVNSGSSIPIPNITSDFQHEVELVVAIDKEGKDIPVENALDHIYGYAVGIDMTCRDLQTEAKEQGKPWTMAKSLPHSAPVSDLTPIENCGHIRSGSICLSVNGVVQQDSDIKYMIRKVDQIIHELSKMYTLYPGDLIFTGTPEGVGPVNSGDEIRAEIEGLSLLTCKFI